MKNNQNPEVDRALTTANAEWSENDTAAFLAFSEMFVPDREVQTDVVCSAVPQTDSSATILDLCCGEGLLSRALLERCPRARIKALDGTEAMVARARETLAPFGARARVSHFRLEDLSWRARFRDCHGVVSSLAIHHLDGQGKRQLFADVFSMLAPGGALVIADLVLPTHAEGLEIAARA